MNRRQLIAAAVAIPAAAGVKKPNVNTMSVEELIAYIQKHIDEAARDMLAGVEAWRDSLIDNDPAVYDVLDDISKAQS